MGDAVELRLAEAQGRRRLNLRQCRDGTAEGGAQRRARRCPPRDDVVGLQLESIALLTDAFADAAKIVMKPTSATPIISALAVVEVRFGFRAAFSRAS